MEPIREYLLSVTAAALICGVVRGFAGKGGATAKLLKLLCGIFLAVTVIRPVVNIKLDDFYDFTDRLSAEGEMAVAMGEEMASDEMKRIIKEKAEAYILDKAKLLGAEIQVEVFLEDLVPAAAVMSGNISPFAKSSLSESIYKDLDIPAEEQIWNRS